MSYKYDGFSPLPPNNYFEQDLSRRFEQTYKVLKPFARDEKGNFLNDSEFEKLVEGDKVDIQEKIDSYFEDCDLYSILAKCAKVEDYVNFSFRQGLNADLSKMPNNFNDMYSYYSKLSNSVKDLPSDIKNLVIGGASDEEIYSYLNQKNVNNNVEKKEVQDGGSTK